MDTNKKAYLALAVLILLYVALSVGLPPDPAVLAQYHISQTRAEVITLSVILPFAAIWLAGVYGFATLFHYAHGIIKNKDGQAFRLIAVGLGVLAFRFPISAVVSSILNYYARSHADFLPAATIFSNYLSVIVAVIGFSFISMGAEKLLVLSKKQPSIYIRSAYTVAALVLAAMYTYLAIGGDGYHVPNPGSRATYYLPAWLIVSTIIIPYVYAWYKGFSAVVNLIFYRKTVPGTLYKQSLQLLAVGIVVVIFSSVTLQFFGAQSTRLTKLHLGPLLMLIYLILLVLAAGYILIALGAKKLRRIEEV